MRYAVTLQQDDNGTILVCVPDLPSAFTFGVDREDALTRAVEAIETAIMGHIAADEDIPPPRTEGEISVALPVSTVAKVELYRAMRAEGIGKDALAKRLNAPLTQIDRLLDLRRDTRLDVLERAFVGLGRTLDIVVGKAA